MKKSSGFVLYFSIVSAASSCGSSPAAAPDDAAPDVSSGESASEADPTAPPDSALDSSPQPDAPPSDADSGADTFDTSPETGSDTATDGALDGSPDTIGDVAGDGVADGGDSPGDVHEVGPVIPDGGVCVPGSPVCASTTSLGACDTAGQLPTTGTACVGRTPSCLRGVCVACSPTAKTCSTSNAFEVCDATGNWGTPTSCPFVCTGSGECTGECVPKEAKCTGNVAQTCDSTGHWGSGTACVFACVGGACSGECPVGRSRCVGTALQKCDATAHWIPDSTCPFACYGGVCTGSCAPALTDCNPKGSISSGPISVSACSEAGTNVTTSTYGTCQYNCIPGSRECTTVVVSPVGKVDAVLICRADGLGYQPIGGPSNTCIGKGSCTDGHCGDSCTTGATECNGSTVNTCVGGRWTATSTCATGMCTGAGTCTACRPGREQCAGLQPQSCDASGSWQPLGITCGLSCNQGFCGCEAPDRFTPTLAGTLDKVTGLRWSPLTSAATTSWSGASAACAAAGGRLPTVSEFTAISTTQAIDPRCLTATDQSFGFGTATMWTADTSAKGHMAYSMTIPPAAADSVSTTSYAYTCVRP
jgi:hypothetical protein